MAARIEQVSVSPGGVPKRPVPHANLTRKGVEGDGQHDQRYHGGPHQAVCLFDGAQLEVLKTEGFPVFPGALGENLTTRGLDYRSARIGDVYRAGGATLQITKPRVPCKTIQVYGEPIIRRLWGLRVPWGESGFYARVLQEGVVRTGDVVRLEAPGSEAPPAFTRKLSLSV